MKVYKVSDYTKPPQVILNPDILFELTKKLMKCASAFTYEETKEFIKQLKVLKSLSPQSSEIRDWCESRLSQYLCLICKKDPSIYSNNSIKICENCVQNLEKQKKCINCKRKYQSLECFSVCNHFCIYCCSYLFLRKSLSTCQICNQDLTKIKTIISNCDNPQAESHTIGESMQLYENSMSILVCGHSYCGQCSKIILKKGSCLDPQCNHHLTPAQKNLLTYQISAKCFKCKKIKLYSDLEFSKCCQQNICSVCSKPNSPCPVCAHHNIIKK